MLFLWVMVFFATLFLVFAVRTYKGVWLLAHTAISSMFSMLALDHLFQI